MVLLQLHKACTFMMLLHDFLMQYCVVVDVSFDQFHQKVVSGRSGCL